MSEKSSPGHVVLHLRFKLRVPPDAVLAHSAEGAIKIASAEGLIWKIWLVDQARREMGGVYLFASREDAEAYLNHPIIHALCSNPAVMATDSQIWEINGFLSALTRGPLTDLRMEKQQQEALLAGGR
jgi:putative monooxygenase ydhR